MPCKTQIDIDAVRAEFPMLKKPGLVYLDIAATSLKPQPVIDAISQYYGQECGTVHRAVYGLAARATNKYDEVRKKVCTFIHASRPEEIIFTRGATDGINVVAGTYGEMMVKEGDEILISAMEHHSNLVPWQILCMRKKAKLKIIPVSDAAELDLEALGSMLSERTKLVSIAHMTNVTGTVYPIKQVIQMAHQVNAKVLIDGAQAAPHTAIDVQDLDADFYVFSGHKLYGPTGVGVLYGKYDLLCAMPPYQGGGDMIDQVTFNHTSYQTPPNKFEAGTPAISSILGLGAAIDYLNHHSMEAVTTWERVLVRYALEKLTKIEQVRLIGSPTSRSAVVTFQIDGAHPLDIGSMLDLKGICVRTGHLCAQPTMRRFGIEHAIRISFGLYNTKEEIDAFIEALKLSIQALS